MAEARYKYAEDKLSTAVYILATGKGDVRSRLFDAFMEFHPVNSDDFPAELLEDWLWIKKQLTKFGPVYGADNEVKMGSVRHTLNRIKNSTGEKIAQRIYNLSANLTYYLDDLATER